jgi:predicted enzyme related to lactoylglutathione lyase
MGPRTSYTPGTFSWLDLTTTDVAAAKSFYTGLFGWDTQDHDAGNGAVYTMCRIGNADVCGLFAMSDEMRAGGVRSGWTSYVTVASADATASRATELGGGVANEPFDVLDAGRMALLTDPQGAMLAVWEPRARIGAELVNDVGALTMNELATTDIGAARGFYEALFGWTTQPIDTGPDGPPMVSVLNADRLNASITAVQGNAPPHWRPYFTVEAIDAAVDRVRELDGTVVLEPIEIPDGSIAMFVDPQGALFALFAGEVDP